MRFIDLFAGLGGFHVALSDLGHTCVFASEINTALADLYNDNFGIYPEGDIRTVSNDAIPDHDILCAGFPCQPFSKAGSQTGLSDPIDGTLFREVIRVLAAKQPQYFILENVPNLVKHDNEETWRIMRSELSHAGYTAIQSEFSPEHFGVPQHRKRIFIVGEKGDTINYSFPSWSAPIKSLSNYLDNDVAENSLSPKVLEALAIWEEFLQRYPSDRPLPSFPIWGMEFGADYPYRDQTPASMSFAELTAAPYHGTLGQPISVSSKDQILALLPTYARTDQLQFPSWKIRFIEQNRQLYLDNLPWISDWKTRLYSLPPSLQKLEWNAKGERRTFSDKILQLRPSGIRVKRGSTIPALVAMTATQVPILGATKRHLTPIECARLQGLPVDRNPTFRLPKQAQKAYSAIGNAVQVNVVKELARTLGQHTSVSWACQSLEFPNSSRKDCACTTPT